jgi:hypothetical protein
VIQPSSCIISNRRASNRSNARNGAAVARIYQAHLRAKENLLVVANMVKAPKRLLKKMFNEPSSADYKDHD